MQSRRLGFPSAHVSCTGRGGMAQARVMRNTAKLMCTARALRWEERMVCFNQAA
jgi:hypothetical protein